MPPHVVKSVKDLIFWKYAGLMSESAGRGKEEWGLRMSFFLKLKRGETVWSTTVREWLREMEKPDVCIYCGKSGTLTTEHILPRSCGGEDCVDNVVRVCSHCNCSKGGKRLYEWKGLENRGNHSRIAEGKYLKYLYMRHEKRGTLDCCDIKELCKNCNMDKVCEAENHAGKLTVYCLEGCFYK